jgi:hypothetical protein
MSIFVSFRYRNLTGSQLGLEKIIMNFPVKLTRFELRVALSGFRPPGGAVFTLARLRRDSRPALLPVSAGDPGF